MWTFDKMNNKKNSYDNDIQRFMNANRKTNKCICKWVTESSVTASLGHQPSTWPYQLQDHSQSLQWRQNEHDSISNHQSPDCLLNRLFRCRSKKTSKLCVTGLCEKKFLFDDAIMVYATGCHWCCCSTDHLMSSGLGIYHPHQVINGSMIIQFS